MATYYFDASIGNDNNSSTQAQNPATPWQTVKKLNNIFSSLLAGDIVLFNRGQIFYGGITVNKSGISGSPIKFGAYGSGAKPIITGLSDAIGFTNIGNNVWQSAAIATGEATLARMATINDTKIMMGRYPATGWRTYTGGTATSIIDASLPNSPSFVGAEAIVRKNNFWMGRGTISSQSGGLVFTNSGSDASTGVTAGYGYFIENDIKTITPGAISGHTPLQNFWFYNPSTKTLSIYSPSGMPVNAKVATIDALISAVSRSFITFDSIVFDGCNGRFIEGAGSNSIIFTNCDIKNTGKDALWISNATNGQMLNCTFTDINNAIAIGSTTTNWLFQDIIGTNIGSDPGGVDATAGPLQGFRIFGGTTGGNTWRRVSLTNIGHHGINFQGSNILVDSCFVNNFAMLLADGGGIYTWRGFSDTTTYLNRIVQHSIVINSHSDLTGVVTPSDATLLAAAFYMDDSTENVQLLRNSDANCPRGIYLHNAFNITEDSNTSYNHTYGGLYYKNDGGHVITGVTITNNKVCEVTNNIEAFRYRSTAADITSSGSASNNVYARPLADTTTMMTELNTTGTLYTLANFKAAFSGRETGSTASPITVSDSSKIRFEYNATTSPVTISLGANYIDLKNVSYNGSITLQPFTSVILLQTGSLTNNPPVANAGVDQSITLPTSGVTLSGSGTDSDGTIAAYAWSTASGPNIPTITTPNSASTTVSGLIQGTYVFQLTVTDNLGATGTDTMNVVVNPAPVNNPPTANAGPDKTITLPTNSVTLSGSGTDTDGTIASYLWTKISGPSTFMIGSPTSASTVISNLVQGTYIFQLTVTDNQGATGSDTVTVVVNPAPNVPPTANAGVDQAITLPTSSVTLNGTGVDTDGTVVAYNWIQTAGPNSSSITTPNAASTGVAGLIQGTYTFQLTVTDNGGATGSDTMNVVVNPAVNIPPTANAGPDQTITLPTNSVTLNGSLSTDPDGTIVSYLWSKVSGPTTFTINSPTSVSTLLSNLVAGTYVFQLLVTDNVGGTGTDTVTIIVNPAANIPPTANAGPDQTITLPTSQVTLVGTGIDTDGTVVAYNWSQLSGPATSFSTSTATTTVTGLVQGTFVFRLTVTDNQGATGTDDVTITVNAATTQNIAPVANAGPDQTINFPTRTVTLNGSNSFDPDGTIVAYKWRKISGPESITIQNSNSVTTIVTNLVRGTYVIQLKVTDNNGATGRDTMNIYVH